MKLTLLLVCPLLLPPHDGDMTWAAALPWWVLASPSSSHAASAPTEL